MFFPRVRPLLSVALLGGATTALGCSAKIVYPVQQDDRPRMPDATAERLRACVNEFGRDLRRGYYTFDYTVKVDEEGRVLDVESKDVPHADLAGCTRIALRGMTVPEELLGLRKLRLSESPANGRATGERGLVGNPAVLVAGIARWTRRHRERRSMASLDLITISTRPTRTRRTANASGNP